MKKFERNSSGFTFTELIMVVVILGMVAAFAIPDYTASRDRAREKSMVFNLEIIHDAWKLARAQGRLDPASAAIAALPWDIAKINSILDVFIVEEDGVDYDCSVSATAGRNYECIADKTGDWTLIIDPETSTAPSCDSGSCPRCMPGCPY